MPTFISLINKIHAYEKANDDDSLQISEEKIWRIYKAKTTQTRKINTKADSPLSRYRDTLAKRSSPRAAPPKIPFRADRGQKGE
jgi:hypothetical protein